MKFGDEEWFAKVEENYEFPLVLAFYLSNKEKSINSMVVESKAFNVGDIKYSKISPNIVLDNGEHVALLGVKRVHSAKDYHDYAKGFHDHWDKEATQ